MPGFLTSGVNSLLKTGVSRGHGSVPPNQTRQRTPRRRLPPPPTPLTPRARRGSLVRALAAAHRVPRIHRARRGPPARASSLGWGRSFARASYYGEGHCTEIIGGEGSHGPLEGTKGFSNDFFHMASSEDVGLFRSPSTHVGLFRPVVNDTRYHVDDTIPKCI